MVQTRFDAPLELKFASAEAGVFEGYASVFHVTDNAGDIIVPGAFKKTLKVWEERGIWPPLLWQHDSTQPIGAWRVMREDARGLYVEGTLFLDDIPRAKEALRLINEKVVTGLSIGYKTRQSRNDEKSGVRVLTEIELLEVSLVTFPANEHARVIPPRNIFTRGMAPTEREFESFLREAGLSRRQAKGVLAAGYKAIAQEDAASESDAAIINDIHALAAHIRDMV